MIQYDESLYDVAIPVLEDVVRRYKSINHVWGEINSKTLLLLCRNQKGEEDFTDIAKEIKNQAERMNYRYNVSILDTFINKGHVEYFQLFFL